MGTSSVDRSPYAAVELKGDLLRQIDIRSLSFNELILLLASLKAAGRAVTDKIKGTDVIDGVEPLLLERMASADQTSVKSLVDGSEYTVTAVTSSRTSIDEIALLSAIGEEAFEQLTMRSIDPDKVAAAIANGSIPEQVAQACIRVTTNKPYVKLTTKKQKEDTTEPETPAPKLKPKVNKARRMTEAGQRLQRVKAKQK